MSRPNFNLFIFILFALSFLVNAQNLNNLPLNNRLKKTSLKTYASKILLENCDDYRRRDCQDHEAHCSHHCSDLHNLVPTENRIILTNFLAADTKMSWYLHRHYKTPFLDPALKPPRFF